MAGGISSVFILEKNYVRHKKLQHVRLSLSFCPPFYSDRCSIQSSLLSRDTWLVHVDPLPCDPCHCVPLNGLLGCGNIGAGLCCRAYQEIHSTRIVPLISHTQAHKYVRRRGIFSDYDLFFDERSKMIQGLTENMRKRGTRNVLIGCCLS